MLMIAFWLAVATFFIPKKYKQVCGYICIGIAVIGMIYHFYLFFTHSFFGEYLYRILNFGSKIDPVFLIFRHIINYSEEINIFIILLRYLIYIGIAFAAMNVSVIKYESDKEFDSNTEIASDEIIVTNDGKLVRVVEVNAGLCTGTLRGIALEARINQVAALGWKFEQYETIIGRCCLFFPRYKAIICFSKEK